jgi:hypothetical protein
MYFPIICSVATHSVRTESGVNEHEASRRSLALAGHVCGGLPELGFGGRVRRDLRPSVRREASHGGRHQGGDLRRGADGRGDGRGGCEDRGEGRFSGVPFVASPEASGGSSYEADTMLAVRHGVHEGYERVVLDLGTGEEPTETVPVWTS